MISFSAVLLPIVEGVVTSQTIGDPIPSTWDLASRSAVVAILLVVAWPLMSIGARAMFSNTKSEFARPVIVGGSLIGLLLFITCLAIGFHGLRYSEQRFMMIMLATGSLIVVILTLMHWIHVSNIQRINRESNCEYLPHAGATTAGMEDIIQQTNRRFDCLVITGNNMVNNWHAALAKVAHKAATEGWQIRIIIMNDDPALCAQASAISGTSVATIRDQIANTQQKLGTIAKSCPKGITVKSLNRVPPCTMWLSDNGKHKRVNLETMFCTDNGDGPVFRSTDPALFAKCAIEFDALWDAAI